MPKKEDFQKELKEKVKPGIKPSQLKRSKSSENITTLKPDTPPLTKSHSAQEINLPLKPSLAEQVKQLKQELVFRQNTAQNYLERLQSLEAENDKLKETANTKIEKANERVKKYSEKVSELEVTNNKLIDKNNELRLQALKDADKIGEFDKEIETAANKLVNIQQSQINFQVQNSQLLREKSDLEKQLKRAEERIQKLYQLKGLPNRVNNSNFPKFSTLFTLSLLITGIIYLLKEK